MSKNRFILASENPGKLKEFAKLCADFDIAIVSAREAGVYDFPPEDGDSYQANALIKAQHAVAQSGLPAIADDSGLEVDALDGRPGLYSARFGNKQNDGERVAYMLEQLTHIPSTQRGAHFHCHIALALPDGRAQHFVGRCSGTIASTPQGKEGFGYDPIFISDDLGISFAEASREQKGRVSHRARALQSFATWLHSPKAKQILAL